MSVTASVVSNWPVVISVVDRERIDRLLDRISEDLGELTKLGEFGSALINDRIRLAAVKYYFITAIEGCARVAQHIIAAQGWPVAESNADAVRRLGANGVLPPPLAESVAKAVGFRNVLVHEYAEIDNQRVVANVRRLGDIEDFVKTVAAWSNSA